MEIYMLVQKFSSKNAMEKGEKWSGKHIARSGVANTWPEVELSGNNMVLLVVPFVRAFAFKKRFSIFIFLANNITSVEAAKVLGYHVSSYSKL
jgi:hypothetical protein